MKITIALGIGTILVAAWAAPAGADIALLKTGTSNVLYLYNNDGTENNAFGGGTTNQYTSTGTNLLDVALLSTGKIAFAVGGSPQVRILSADGSSTTPITLPGSPGYGERICSLPNGGFAVSTWYTNTTMIFFYDYDSGTDTFSAAGSVDFYALTGKAVLPTSNSSDLTLAGGQISSTTPDVAFLGVDVANQQKVWFLDKNGEVAGTSCISTLDSADAWIAATGTGGLAVDPVNGAVDSAVASVYQWPRNTDFALYTQVDTEQKLTDGVGGATNQDWIDVAVDPADTSRLLAVNNYTAAGTPGVYTIVLDPGNGTVTATKLMDIPAALNYTTMARIDTTLPVPEPATMALLALGFFGLNAVRPRRR